MTDRAINFTAPMVRALISGTKTQDRRVLKPQPRGWPWYWEGDEVDPVPGWFDGYEEGREPCGAATYEVNDPIKVPAAGDRLWVRETWSEVPASAYRMSDGVQQTVNPDDPHEAAVYAAGWERYAPPWRSSTQMPRWASRLTLIVTDVRVERLQDISEADAIAEGATSRPGCYGFNGLRDGWSMDWSQVGAHSRYAENGPGPLTERDVALVDPSSAFGAYVNELHGGPSWNLKPTDLWTENPWVAAITFETHRCNIDAMPAKADDGWTDWPAMAGATDKVGA